MTYKIAKLVSDYVSPEIFVNRLELGDSGLGGPVDLRFIGEPGWIENAHSVFLGVDGRDAYSPTNTGGLITLFDTGDLVFFDPSNAAGRTLTQLYAGGGGGLWVDDLAYVRLTTARALDIGEQNIDNVGERIQFDTSQIYSKIQFHGTADALIYSHVEAPDPIVDRWDFFIDDVSRFTVGVDGIDAWEPLDMNNEKITGLPAATAAGEAIAAGTDGYIPLANVPLGAPGVKGDILVGTVAGCSTLYAGADTHVLTLDSTAALGVKWAAQTGGSGLWQDTGYTNLITPDDIDMQGKSLVLVEKITGGDSDPVTPIFAVDAITGHDIRLLAPSGQTAWIYGGGSTAISATGTLVGVYQNLIMAAGKYIKADSGNLELRAPTGGSIDNLINSVYCMSVYSGGVDMCSKKITGLDYVDFDNRASAPATSPPGRLYFYKSGGVGELRYADNLGNWKTIATV